MNHAQSAKFEYKVRCCTLVIIWKTKFCYTASQEGKSQVACEYSHLFSLLVARNVSQKRRLRFSDGISILINSGEEQGETTVFAG